MKLMEQTQVGLLEILQVNHLEAREIGHLSGNDLVNCQVIREGNNQENFEGPTQGHSLDFFQWITTQCPSTAENKWVRKQVNLWGNWLDCLVHDLV